MKYAIHPSTVIALDMDGERTYLTMGEFLEANEGIDREPIIETIREGRVYHGGGGAAPEWAVAYQCQGFMHWTKGDLQYMADRGEGELQTRAKAELVRRQGAMSALRASMVAA